MGPLRTLSVPILPQRGWVQSIVQTRSRTHATRPAPTESAPEDASRIVSEHAGPTCRLTGIGSGRWPALRLSLAVSAVISPTSVSNSRTNLQIEIAITPCRDQSSGNENGRKSCVPVSHSRFTRPRTWFLARALHTSLPADSPFPPAVGLGCPGPGRWKGLPQVETWAGVWQGGVAADCDWNATVWQIERHPGRRLAIHVRSFR
jgi:hypothetical protein